VAQCRRIRLARFTLDPGLQLERSHPVNLQREKRRRPVGFVSQNDVAGTVAEPAAAQRSNPRRMQGIEGTLELLIGLELAANIAGRLYLDYHCPASAIAIR
jgi:hypothetical protein